MGVISLFLASSSSTRSFLRKIERAVSGFSGPPRHHVPPSQPQPLPRELLTAEFVFVRDDASKPPLSPLYWGPYKVLERFENLFILQIGDMLSKNWLMYMYSNVFIKHYNCSYSLANETVCLKFKKIMFRHFLNLIIKLKFWTSRYRKRKMKITGRVNLNFWTFWIIKMTLSGSFLFYDFFCILEFKISFSWENF